MSDPVNWSVDRLAANNLLADLKLEAVPDLLDQVAEHFARHREDAIGWAAERAHSSIAGKLETALMNRFEPGSDEWRSGYCWAEQQVLTMMPDELLALGPDRARSKGQILRSMVREARHRQSMP